MAEAKTQELLCAYLVVGDDALKREAVINRLKIRLEEVGDLSFNYDTFNAEVASAQDIIAACTTIPFASEKRLVLVTNAEKLKQQDVGAIITYLDNPLTSTVLCLVAEKLAKTSKLSKAVAALGASALIDCARPKRSELPHQVKQMASSYGLVLDGRAITKLIELVGDDTVRIDSELKKLSLSQEGGTTVTERDITALIAPSVEPKPWEFVDAFSARDIKTCMTLLPKMPSVSPHSLIAMCASRIRELICVVSAYETGTLSESFLAQELSLPEWRLKKHLRWSRSFSKEELRAALVSSCDTERKMKSGADACTAFVDWVISVLKR